MPAALSPRKSSHAWYVLEPSSSTLCHCRRCHAFRCHRFRRRRRRRICGSRDGARAAARAATAALPAAAMPARRRHRFATADAVARVAMRGGFVFFEVGLRLSYLGALQMHS